MLKLNVGLERLSVRKFLIADNGVGIICDNLAHNHALRFLDLGW